MKNCFYYMLAFFIFILYLASLLGLFTLLLVFQALCAILGIIVLLLSKKSIMWIAKKCYKEITTCCCYRL
jgi:hypothetical protein